MPYHPRELPDISRHVTAFVETVFEDRAQGRGGAEYNLVCPFCGGEEAAPKKKLYLNRKTGLWICFRCEKKGTFPWLVKQMAKDDPDINVREFLSGLEDASVGADLSLFGWRDRKVSPPKAPTQPTFVTPTGLVPVWKEHTSTIAEARRLRGLKYLGSRGVSDTLAEYYQIHVGVVGRYEGRVVVPVFDPETHLAVGWVARTYGLREPKVLNTPVQDGHSLDDTLFNLDKARGVLNEVVIVEGVFDAMKHGPHFLALFGKALKQKQFLALMKAKFGKVTVMLDKDAAKECRAMARALKFHMPAVHYAWLTTAKDPGAATRAQVLEALAAAKPA